MKYLLLSLLLICIDLPANSLTKLGWKSNITCSNLDSLYSEEELPTINFRIKDEKDVPLEGAIIFIRGYNFTIGVVTDSLGECKLFLSKKIKYTELEVSYIGYENFTIPFITESKTFIIVKMERVKHIIPD